MTTIDEAKARLRSLVEHAEWAEVEEDLVRVAHLRTLLAHTADYDALKGRLEEAVRLMGPFAELSAAQGGSPHAVINAERRSLPPLLFERLRGMAAFIDREKEAGRG